MKWRNAKLRTLVKQNTHTHSNRSYHRIAWFSLCDAVLSTIRNFTYIVRISEQTKMKIICITSILSRIGLDWNCAWTQFYFIFICLRHTLSVISVCIRARACVCQVHRLTVIITVISVPVPQPPNTIPFIHIRSPGKN